jgi:hypothetical protein
MLPVCDALRLGVAETERDTEVERLGDTDDDAQKLALLYKTAALPLSNAVMTVRSMEPSRQ